MATGRTAKSAVGLGPNLAAMDLNLMVAFEALWVERSVTAAGRRLGLSQPATSAALARLRDMLGDRLFVRGKRGLEPTERCAELAPPLCEILLSLRKLVAGSSFDPSTTTRQLRIGAVDAASAVVLPSVLQRTMREAPGAQVQVIAINPARATEALEDGLVDVALSPRPSSSATVRSRPLYPVDFVIAVRAGHPLTRGEIDEAALRGFPRVSVGFEGSPPANVAVLLSSFLAVPPVLTASDAWGMLPRPYAEMLVREGQIAALPPPASMATFAMQMQLLWPDAQDSAPASRWLRGIILDVTRPGVEVTRPAAAG